MRRTLLTAVLAAGCLSGPGWAQSPRDGDRPAPPSRPADPPAENRVEDRAGADRRADADRGPAARPDQPGRTEKGAYLGVATSAAPRALRHQVELPKGVGLVVDAVAPDSPAAAAGLRPDDLLHKLNDQILINPQQLAVLVRTFEPGTAVTLTVIRGGKPVELSAKLVEKDLRPLEEMRLGDPFGLPDAPSGRPVPRGPQPDRRPFAPGGLGDALGDDPAHPFPPGVLTSDTFAMTWDDGVISIDITAVNGRKTLVAKDKAGKQLCNGPVDTPEQQDALPPAVRERLHRVGLPGLFRLAPAGGKNDPATRPAAGALLDEGDDDDDHRDGASGTST